MSSRKGWLARVAGAVTPPWRRARRAPEAEPVADPRADELRQKLEESRAVVEEQHEEAASPETPVDEADLGIEERRAAVHERARAAAEEMRRTE